MFVNLHELPMGQEMFTIAVTTQPVRTVEADREVDELDVIVPRGATVKQAIELADLPGNGYEGCRVVGVINQSGGYVIIESWEGVQ